MCNFSLSVIRSPPPLSHPFILTSSLSYPSFPLSLIPSSFLSFSPFPLLPSCAALRPQSSLVSLPLLSPTLSAHNAGALPPLHTSTSGLTSAPQIPHSQVRPNLSAFLLRQHPSLPLSFPFFRLFLTVLDNFSALPSQQSVPMNLLNFLFFN